MAYINTFTITDVPVICTGSGTHDWISADFKIIATPNNQNTAYTVQIYARIDAGGWMEWDGTCVLKVKCNGVVLTTNMKLAMYNGSEGGLTQWDGPATFLFGNTEATNLKFEYITIDLTSTTGTNGKPGIYHVTDDGNMTAFTKNNYTITIGDGGLQPLLQPPVISNITNENPFNSNNSVSDYTDRIILSWDSDVSVTGSYYRINDGDWVNFPYPITKLSLYNLTPGTNYKIDIYSKNGAGVGNTLTTTIRTRHLTPELKLNFGSKSIDKIIYNWTSTKELASTEYRIGTTGEWKNANSTGTSGSFTLDKLEPNTKYTIFFRGVSTDTYDNLSSNEEYNTTTTFNTAKLVSASNLIFGEDFLININHPSDRVATLILNVSGNSRTAQSEFNLVNGNNTISMTQEQLDSIYKCFTNSNTIDIKMTLKTIGEWKTYIEEKIYTLKLTGKAKTAHLYANGNKRAEVFLGVYNIPRRGIFWVGDKNNIPRRCI